jgi:hypothetical protein
MKFRDEMANIDFVKVDYLEFSKKTMWKLPLRILQIILNYIQQGLKRLLAEILLMLISCNAKCSGWCCHFERNQ